MNTEITVSAKKRGNQAYRQLPELTLFRVMRNKTAIVSCNKLLWHGHPVGAGTC